MRNGAITSWPACLLEERRALWRLRRETDKIQSVGSTNMDLESLKDVLWMSSPRFGCQPALRASAEVVSLSGRV